jgi:nicotinamide riboside transporter PnuC
MNIVIETIGFASMVLAVVGVVYNNRMNRKCFYFWLVSNILGLAVHLASGVGAMAIRDVIFIILAVQGWRTWKRLHN